MGGFFDAQGLLTRSAVLNRASLTMREDTPDASGWRFNRGDSKALMRLITGRIPVDTQEAEGNGDPAQPRKGRKAVNSQAER